MLTMCPSILKNKISQSYLYVCSQKEESQCSRLTVPTKRKLMDIGRGSVFRHCPSLP